MPLLIDGKRISQEIKDELKERTARLKEEGIGVCLAVIQVGNDPASSVYVRNKKKACAYTGIESRSYELPEEISQEELLSLIRELNADDSVTGILVQLPIPPHLDEREVIHAISPEKDVDGFHPQSVGSLSIGEPGFVSCTPAGIIQLLKRSGIEIEGRECVVVGRSNIVGKPMGMLLLRENGTVTMCHSRTRGDDLTILNPGSLAYPRQKDGIPTFLIMETDDYGDTHFGHGFYHHDPNRTRQVKEET